MSSDNHVQMEHLRHMNFNKCKANRYNSLYKITGMLCYNWNVWEVCICEKFIHIHTVHNNKNGIQECYVTIGMFKKYAYITKKKLPYIKQCIKLLKHVFI